MHNNGLNGMASSSKLLTEQVVEEAKYQLRKIGKAALISRKLEAVIAAKTHGISQVAKIYDITRTTLTSWIKHIQNGSIERLNAPAERKRKNKLNDMQRGQILEWIKADSQLTIKAIRIKIENVFNIEISKSTVHREIKKLNYSYIKPRPKHFKQDQNKVAEFKKNISQEIASCKPSHILFFDESRFGTHSKISYGWYERGTRPQIPFKIGYQNFYLYSAVNINDGSNFSLILPNVDTEHMNVFLSELVKEHPYDKIALIMDGAGWHKSKTLRIPDNVTIFYLPPYSPELNPVERLWLYIKNNILSNKIYETLEALEAVLCEFMRELKNIIVKSICTVSYLSI